MKTLTQILHFFLFTAILLPSCNKERKPLNWNVDLVAPLIYGELTVKDLLKDTLLTSNSNNSVQLSFETSLYKLDFDSLVKVPDTIIKNGYTIPFSAGITFSPGQTFISEPEDITLEIEDVELTKLSIKNGEIEYSLSSNIPAEIIYEYTISNAFNNQGIPFVKQLIVPASGSTNSTISGSFDLSGYVIDLTGTNGSNYNTLSTLINMKLTDDHQEDLLLSNVDSVKIENKISGLSIQYAKGYFGNQIIPTQNSSSEIKQMNNITGGSIDIEQVDVKLNIVNGIGADATFNLQSLVSKSSTSTIPLSHQLIGDENFINRASYNGGNVSTTEFSTTFNSSNSNIENWLENLPGSVSYSLGFELNPIGNVSGHNDFIDASAPFEVNMQVDMPLSLLADNLTLVDTIMLNVDNMTQVVKGKLNINIDNGFPLEASLSLKSKFSDEELFSETPIVSAAIDNNGIVNQPISSTHEITFSEETLNFLKEDNTLIIQIKFNSPPSSSLIAIYDYYNLKFNVTSDFTYQTDIK